MTDIAALNALLEPEVESLGYRLVRVAFLGGYNIGSAYATEWRDTHIRLTGPAVWDLKRAFAEDRDYAYFLIERGSGDRPGRLLGARLQRPGLES